MALGDGNIISSDGNDLIYLHSGFSSTILSTFSSPSVNITDVTFDGINVISADQGGAGTVYKYSGFSSTVIDSFIGNSDIAGITWDGTNVISSMISGGTARYFKHSGFSSTIIDSFDDPTLNETEGITWDGANLIAIDPNANKIYKFSGFGTPIIDSFADAAGNGFGVAFSGSNLISSDIVTALHYKHNGFTASITETYSTPDSNPRGMEWDILAVVDSDTTGIATITFPQFTVVGTRGFHGVIQITLPNITSDFVGLTGSIDGTTIALPAFTISIRTGLTNSTLLPQLSLAATGHSGFVGTFAKSLPRMIVNVKGTVHRNATFDVSLPAFTLGNTVLTGNISLASTRNLPVFDLNAHGFRGENGDGALTFPAFTLATESYQSLSGTVVQSLKMLTLDAFADSYTNRII